ncbi:hypothetical protein UA08_00359 [Talaromyces atroroseus]|uniref:Chromatin assembly factor 1 subunit A n=1 Tax=Talaromyces atroroseus TaxID=1441469 RepID=A0A225ASN8_TALAT|nr:hypothetical protein UA08_00359 [Talaromyces atroroseus]OKL64000.1 hypothetical protein UA08_00359 [Talaromyces atroroseus]
MEVSVEFKPSTTPAATASPFSPTPSSASPTVSSSRKRAFSELEDGNAVQNPETSKLQKRDDDGADLEDRENRDPSIYESQNMEIDKPSSNVIVPAFQNTPIIYGPDASTSTLSSNADASSMNKALAALPAASHTPHNTQQQQTIHPNQTVSLPDSKKQKLSPADKETKRLEKEEKDRLKLEEKARKEAEKQAKEEEKKRREAEREEERKKREEKKKIKEEEKQAKEEEKRKKEEEKTKKERSQMRLNAFFAKPTASTAKPANIGPPSPQKGLTQETAKPLSPGKTREASQSNYRKEFPAFFLQSNTHLSPPHQFQRDSEALYHICQKLDGFLKQPTTPPAYRGSELFDMIPYQRRNGRNIKSVRTIVNSAQNESNHINLAEPNTTFLRDQLKKVTMKSLRFGEDVRPPYYGTFTKPLSHNQAHKLCRAPYTRIIPGVNYDYDSEAEWEEPEEGEDLDSEGEEDVSDDGDDDMDGFLDDEEEQIDGRRRLIVGDLEPVSTGIRWHDEGKVDPDMEVYRIEALSETIQFPIDPFSTAHWPKPKAVEQAASKGPSSLVPARSTLHAYSTNTSSHTQLPLAPPSRPVAAVKGKPFPAEHLVEFKETVEGCDLTKAGLIEVLKKRFPKISKDTLKDTVNAVAVRVGQKEADKKWTCK